MIFNNLFLLLFISALSGIQSSFIVQTGDGLIEGIKYSTEEGRQIFAFLGVPYAKPPTGALRFREPQRLDRWNGVWPALSFASKCIQHTYYKSNPNPIIGEEDCLYLNVFTPSLSNYTKLDVIFYIHGGAFMFGGGDMFLPDYILHRSDVVFVSINYRLGPFGFMTTEDGVIPGNLGMKDQVMALKWVKDNIEQFGGDKHKVTLAGLSSGGASVHLHYLSPMSKDLFQKGISVSGSAFCPWVLAENARSKAQILGNSVGCPTGESMELLECLQSRSARQILSEINKLFMPWNYNPFSPFGVVVERDNKTPFLGENPYNLLKVGAVKDAPWLTSITSEEGLYPAATFITQENLIRELDEKWETIAPHLLDYKNTVSSQELNKVSKKIRKFYFGNNKLTIKNRPGLVKMISDRLFVTDIERATKAQVVATNSPVYFYNFSYRGKHSMTEVFCQCQENLGVSHADDLIYLLKPNFEINSLESDEDREIVNAMTNIWISFVKTGKPSVSSDTVWSPILPKAAENGELTYLQISSSKNMTQQSSEDLGNHSFWDKLPLQELGNAKSQGNKYVDEL